MNHKSHRHDERGATAVLVAVVAMVLFGAGALAIDVGQVYAKRASLQSTVDMAVLAAAAELTEEDSCNSEVISAATTYLTNANMTPDQAAVNLTGAPGDIDGYIKCEDWTVRLWAPKSHVSLGMARAVIESSKAELNVPAYAEAQIKSPNMGDMPFFAASGCAFGRQVLSDNSHGHSKTPPIPLTPSTTTNNSSDVTGLSVTISPVGTAIPTLVISGTNFTGVTKVGFTTAAGDHVEVPGVPGSNMTVDSATKITVTNVQSAVINTDAIWYVRVYNASKWSTNDGNSTFGVEPLTIGPPKLFCQDSSQGNFGSLLIDRTDGKGGGGPNGLLSVNVALGLDHSLAAFPGAPSAPNQCTSGVPGSVTQPVNGQNCVQTDTGLPANALEEGLITGGSGYDGRLEKPATPPCTRPNSSPHGLNDDVLSCFFTNGSIRVGDVGSASYTGDSVIGSEIFDSPRFFWVPIIGFPPNGKKWVSIQGFRAGFITDQPASATRNSPQATAENGLTLSGTKVRQVRVWFINDNALPETVAPRGDEVDYVGSGPKVLVLVG